MTASEQELYRRIQEAEKRAAQLHDDEVAARIKVQDLKNQLEFDKTGPTIEIRDNSYGVSQAILAGIRTRYGVPSLSFYVPLSDGTGFSPGVILPYDQAVILAKFILDNPPTGGQSR